MLTPEYLLRISEGAEQIADELHNYIIGEIIASIIHRLERGDDYILTAKDKYRLETMRQAGHLYENIAAEIARKTRLQENEVLQAFQDAGLESYDYETAFYESVGIVANKALVQSPNMIRIMQRQYEATMGEWYNATRTTADESQKYFINAVDKAYNLTSTGAESYTKAVKDAVEELGQHGVYVNYPTGHRDTIETATLRAVRTGIAQMSGEITIERMKENDWKIVLTTAHVGARNKGGLPENHELWQGKFFSIPPDNTFPDFYKWTGYGTGEGLCGWNCRHSFTPSDGKHNPYKDINTEENARVYNNTQKQRYYERDIRKRKREILALKRAIDELHDETTKFELDQIYQRKAFQLQRQNAKYKEFCSENNLKTLNDRLSIAQWNRSTAVSATAAAKRYKDAQ